MERFNVSNITKDIWVIDDHGEDMIFLIEGQDKALLMDTGLGIGDLKSEIDKITSKPLIVLNSHGHPDHVGGNYQFEEIFIMQEDIPLVESVFGKVERQWMADTFIKEPPQGFNLEIWMQHKSGRLLPLKNGDMFDLGNKSLEVISMPGHTVGSIALLDEKDRILFIADAIDECIWLNQPESSSLETYLKALENLISHYHRFDCIVSSHQKGRLEKDLIDELIEGVTKVLSGRMTGKPFETFAGNGLLYEFKRTSILV